MVNHIAAACLTVLAVTWPMQALGFVPGLRIHAPALVAGVGLLCVALHALKLGRLRIPFELAVPWLAAAAVAGLFVLRGSGWGWTVLAGLAAFALPAQLRPSREHVVTLVRLSSAATTAMAGLTIMGWIRGWMPTAYVLETGASLHFAHQVPGGVVVILVGLIAVLGLMLAPHTRRSTRIVWAVAAIVHGTVIATASAGLLSTVLAPGPPRVYHDGPWAIALALLLLYGVARVAAKLAVDSGERPSTYHAVFFLIVAAAALGEIGTGGVSAVGLGFLAGIVCAYTLPQDEMRWHVHVAVAPAVAVLLLAINLSHVSRANDTDGRNYDAALAADLAAGDYTQLHRRLDLIERLLPEERRTHWWRARAVLAQGKPMRAVTEFAASLDAGSARLVLPAPSIDEQNQFLVSLRDVESSAASPQQRYAYARALVALGNVEEALAFLRLHAENWPGNVDGLDVKPVAQAMAFLLGDAALAETLETWPPETLLGKLRHWGASLLEAPGWLPDDALPAVFVGQVLLETTATLVAMPADHDRQEQPFEVRLTPGTSASYWAPLSGNAKRWVVEWICPSLGRGPARITGRGTQWDLLTYTTTLTEIPESPAIMIWLPRTILPPSTP